MTVRYSDAGVDLDVAESITADIRARLGGGLFGGFLPVSFLKSYDEPVLVSSIDGIGTKVHLAARLGKLGGLGRDIVHHCVNDIACHGAAPLLFLDYLAFGRLDGEMVGTIVAGIADACETLGVALSGGETAEMPLVYPPGRFDIAGAIVGVVERRAIVDGSHIAVGDVLLALPSSGPHTNGYSLIQALVPEEAYNRSIPELESTVGEALLEPHRCYLAEIRGLLSTELVHGLAHITGGGIAGNLSRIMPPHLQAVVELPPAPPLFAYLQALGVEREEMRRVFNMGVGMIAVCDPAILSTPEATGLRVIGRVQQNDSPRRVLFYDDD